MKRRPLNPTWMPLLALSLSLAVPARADEAGQAASPAAASDVIELTNMPDPDGGLAWGRAEGIVAARPEQVLAVLQDYGRYAGLFPYFQKSKILSQRGADALLYLEAKILHGTATLWSQVRMRSSSPEPGVHVVEARKMKGNGKANLAALIARWRISALDGGQRTKVVFELLVDPDLPVPDALVSYELKRSAGRAFKALRRRVADRSTYVSRPRPAL